MTVRDHDLKLATRLAAPLLARLTAMAMAVAAHAGASDGEAHHADVEFGYQIAQSSEVGDMAQATEAGADDAGFLTLLGFMEGHLRAGIELYRQGAADMAKTHMKHRAMNSTSTSNPRWRRAASMASLTLLAARRFPGAPPACNQCPTEGHIVYRQIALHSGTQIPV